MKQICSALFTLILAAVWANPAAAQCGGPPGEGDSGGGRGRNPPPEIPEGGEMGGAVSKSKAPGRLPQIEGLRVTLKYIPHDPKPCDCLQNALTRLSTVKHVAVSPTEATMVFTGDWDQLPAISYAASVVRIKSALVSPGFFSIDYAVEKQTSVKAQEILAKVTGVAKTFGESGKVYLFAPVAQFDPRLIATTLKDAGIKFVALRSHRLRTLSFEPWEKDFRPERIRERLMKVPGVLRVDVDPASNAVTVLLIRDSVKDLELVTAAEDVSCTLFPGKAEEEDEAPPQKADSSTPAK